MNKDSGDWWDRLSRIRPDKAFLRIVTLTVLIVFLLSQAVWSEKLLGRILNFPDLRHQVAVDHGVGSIRGQNFSRATLIVANRGYGTAHDVLVQVMSQPGNILHYEIESDEVYEIRDADLEDERLVVSMDRISSGASLRVHLIGTDITEDNLALSAVSDQGLSASMDTPAFSDQVEDYKAKTVGVFGRAKEILQTEIEEERKASRPVTSISLER